MAPLESTRPSFTTSRALLNTAGGSFWSELQQPRAHPHHIRSALGGAAGIAPSQVLASGLSPSGSCRSRGVTIAGISPPSSPWGDRFKRRAFGVSRNEGLLEPSQHGGRDEDKSLLPGCASAGLPLEAAERCSGPERARPGARAGWGMPTSRGKPAEGEAQNFVFQHRVPPFLLTPPQRRPGRGTARLCPGSTWARTCVPAGQPTAPARPPRAGRCAGSCCLVPGCRDAGTSACPAGKSMESRRLRFKILGGNAIFRKLGRCQCVLPARLMTLTWRSAGTSRSCGSARSPGASQHLLRRWRCHSRTVPGRSNKAEALGGHKTLRDAAPGLPAED